MTVARLNRRVLSARPRRARVEAPVPIEFETIHTGPGISLVRRLVAVALAALAILVLLPAALGAQAAIGI